jgi:transposase
MMGKNENRQAQFVYVNLEDFVPENHLLRKINEAIDFSFIYDLVAPLYAKNGRPSIDPVLLIKMLLIGYLYNIRSERRLEEEVRVNLAYRWFLGLGIEDAVPDHSTFSQNRRRRLEGKGVFRQIFNGIVKQCIELGLVEGELVVTDSTHIKAYASKESVTEQEVEYMTADYFEKLDDAVKQWIDMDEKRRKARGVKKTGPKPKGPQRKKKIVKVSKTDPDARPLGRPGKPDGPHYLAHTTVDTKIGIVLDIEATRGDVNDSTPYLKQMERIEEAFDIDIKSVCADAGYDIGKIQWELEKKGITSYIAPSEANAPKRREGFRFVEESNSFICPSGKRATYRYTEWDVAQGKFVRIYKTHAADCEACPLQAECLTRKEKFKKLKVTPYHEVIERHRKNICTKAYKDAQKLRRIWSEGTNSALKHLHKLMTPFARGLEKIQNECLLSALALNLKRVAKALS